MPPQLLSQKVHGLSHSQIAISLQPGFTCGCHSPPEQSTAIPVATFFAFNVEAHRDYL